MTGKPLTAIEDREAYIEEHDARQERRLSKWQEKCAGKEPFESRTLAQQVARRRSRKGRRSMSYKCRSCGKYHIGSSDRRPA